MPPDSVGDHASAHSDGLDMINGDLHKTEGDTYIAEAPKIPI